MLHSGSQFLGSREAVASFRGLFGNITLNRQRQYLTVCVIGYFNSKILIIYDNYHILFVLNHDVLYFYFYLHLYCNNF